MKLQRKSIYLIPNLITLVALYFGYKSLIETLNQNYIIACQNILLSMFFDGLDGRIARLTNTQTNFGAELDSLADMVSFGIAPAFLIYQHSLAPLGKIGVMISFIFASTTALRLARFNSIQSKYDKIFFEGLPCPAAAGLIAAGLWLLESYDAKLPFQDYTMSALCLLLSLEMISSIAFFSFKVFDRSKIPLYGFMVILIFISLIALHPPLTLFGLFIIYNFIQPLQIVLKKMAKKRQQLSV